MPDFRLQPNFPIATVIDAAGRNAQLQQQAQQYGQQQLVQGLQSIGQIGESLYDTKKRVAQSLALGRQFDVPDDVSKTMSPEQLMQVGTIKKGQVDVHMLMNMLHPGAFGNSSNAVTSPSAAIPDGANSSTPPNTNGAMLASSTTTTPMLQGSQIAPTSAPSQKVNKATSDAAIKLFGMTRPMPVMTKEQALEAGNVPRGTKIVEPTSLNVSEKENQFYQREWDKLLHESDPLNASSRTPLGLASRATFQANRALITLSKPVVTNQEAGNAMADIAAIYQNGSPTQFGMSHQEYATLYGKAQGLVQSITGKPQDAVPDEIKQRLMGVLNDMKNTNSALLTQRLDMTEKTKKSVISRFPDEWKDYRQILEGDQSQYNGLGSSVPSPTAQNGNSWDQAKEQRYQELLAKRAKGSVKL